MTDIWLLSHIWHMISCLEADMQPSPVWSKMRVFFWSCNILFLSWERVNVLKSLEFWQWATSKWTHKHATKWIIWIKSNSLVHNCIQVCWLYFIQNTKYFDVVLKFTYIRSFDNCWFTPRFWSPSERCT